MQVFFSGTCRRSLSHFMLIFINQKPVVVSLRKCNERSSDSWKEHSDKILVLSMWYLRASSIRSLEIAETTPMYCKKLLFSGTEKITDFLNVNSLA